MSTQGQVQVRMYCRNCDGIGMLYDYEGQGGYDIECDFCKDGWVYRWVDVDAEQFIEGYVELVE